MLKQSLFLIALFTLKLFAEQHGGEVVEINAAHPWGLTEGDRYIGDLERTSVPRSGPNYAGKSSVDFDMNSQQYRLNHRLEWVSEIIPTLVCSQVNGNGREGDWKKFYEVKEDQKAKALSAAIKGIGIKTAERLVADGYFKKKPRSWDDFSAVILKADRQYQTGFSSQVLKTHGKENMDKLGYYSKEDCRYVDKEVTVLRDVTRKYPHQTRSRSFQVKTSGAPLLSGEKEEHTMSFDGNGDNISVDEKFNKYTVNKYNDGGTTVYELKGTRKQVTPPNTLTVVPFVKGGKLHLRITDSAFDPKAKSMMGTPYIAVRSIGAGRFFSRPTLGAGTVPLFANKAETEINLNIDVKAQKDVYFSYELQRQGGTAFNTTNSSKIETPWQKINP